MVKDSEKFAAEDEQARKKVEAKNSVENYAYTVRTSLNDEKVMFPRPFGLLDVFILIGSSHT